MQLKYKEILEAEGVSCVEMWKSFQFDPEYTIEMKSRMAKYTREDWEQMKEESAEVIWLFLDAYRKNLPYWSEEAMTAAEAQKNLVDKWWHPNSYEFEVWMAKHAKIKERIGQFGNKKGFYDKFEDGLGDYVYNAILHNARIKTSVIQ